MRIFGWPGSAFGRSPSEVVYRYSVKRTTTFDSDCVLISGDDLVGTSGLQWKFPTANFYFESIGREISWTLEENLYSRVELR